MNVPGFLVRQFYVSGSLRNTKSGFMLQAKNPIGDGSLVGVGRLRVDGVDIDPGAVSAVRESDGETYRASDVSAQRPVVVRQGDRVTLEIKGDPLSPGRHKLEVELTEGSIGTVRLSISDSVG